VNRTWLQVGSLGAFLGVGLGAFGAHALRDRLGEHHPIWETAVQYQLVHSLALLFIGLAASQLPATAVKWIGSLFLGGIVVFSGSLYVLALTNVRWLGAVTPLGGLCFLAGWVTLAYAGGKPPQGPGT